MLKEVPQKQYAHHLWLEFDESYAEEQVNLLLFI